MLLGVLLVLSDGLLKLFLHGQMPRLSRCFVSSWSCLGWHENYGIAFDLAIPFRILLILSAYLFILLANRALYWYKTNPRLCAGYLLVLMGGIGNFIDRVANGFTTDYIILWRLSAINLSDLVVILGVIVLITVHAKKTPQPLSTGMIDDIKNP
ncbi:signal peptidase II [Candidatus Uhrbacteria bacterium]|nr:signal peptidase II [Candidatus Uhrbacteria bacterium]